MKKGILISFALIFMVTITVNRQAQAISIGFDTLPGGFFPAGFVYTEDGFNVETLTQNMSRETGIGTPSPSIAWGALGNNAFKVTRSDGGDFTYQSINVIAYAENWRAGIPISWVGQLNGTSIYTVSQTTPVAPQVWHLMLSTQAGIVVDAVTISGLSNGANIPMLDSIEVTMVEGRLGENPVPEPATIALLGIGLVGLAGAEARRRRRKKAVDES